MLVPGAGQIHFKNWAASHVPEILHEIYVQRIYHPYVIGKKDATFLDIGFNIGLWSLYAAQYAKTVYAFEPTKETYDIGMRNLADNGITNVTAFQKAIAPDDGTTTFYHSSNTTMNSMIQGVNDTKESETVETIRLDTFVKEQGIKRIEFAKIDIEGSESQLFTSESFKNIVPILDAFVYEWHTWGASNFVVLNRGLMDYGYVVHRIPSDATLFICQKK